MKDYLGNALTTGDTVLYLVPNKRKFAVAKIKKIGEHMATLNGNINEYPIIITRYPEVLIKLADD